MLVARTSFAANESPQTFTLDGTLLTSDHISPLLDAAAKVRVQVLNPTKTCVLYDEEQTVNTFSSNGRFTIQVGSPVGSAKRKALDSGNTMAKVYQNTSAITGASCSYTPSPSDVRYVRIIVTPTSSSSETLTPDMVLDAVPNAVVAQSLQGIEKAGFLQVNSSALLTQSKLEQFMQTLTTVPGMGVTYDGVNFQSYDPKNGGLLNANSVTDTQIASVQWAKITGVPAGLNAFATLSCVDGKILKRVSGAWACADESGVGIESDPTVAAYAKNAPGAGLTVSGGAIIADFGTGAGKVVQGNDARLSDARAPNGSASGDLSGSYPSPSVAKIQGRGVSVTAPADGQILRYNNGSSQWEPYNFGIGDLKTNAGTPQFISASCTASETLIWSSVTNTFQCTTIAIAASQVSGLAAAESDPKVGANTTNYLSKWNGSALVASAVVESAGNVGIGTAAPGAPLHVEGIARFSSGSFSLAVSNGSTIAATNHMSLSAGTSYLALASPSNYINYRSGMGHLFQNGNGSTEWMRISATGDVGIGTNSPTTKLDVNGTINATAMTINGVPVGTSTGLTSFNGSSQSSQTFATPGVTGTAPSWSTNTGTGVHTLNIPMANTASVTAGLLSKTDYDNFAGKIGSAYSLVGDVTGTPAATVVDRIKGIGVSATPTLAGQVLRYTGSQFTPAFVSMADLRSQTTGATALATSCAVNQTLTYNSVGDNLACSNISLPAGQVTGTLGIANGGTGQTMPNAALNALLPSQSSQGTKFLQTDGTNTSWQSVVLTETDPKVGANTTNYVSKWNGTALVASGLIDSGGNVGIGTATPTRLLHVNGPIRIAGATLPSSPQAGDIAVDSGDSNKLKYYDGTDWQTAGGGSGGSNVSPAGMVGAFPMATCPTGWLEANGAAVSRTMYASLFTALATTYGPGDGSTTFNLPDYRGYFLRGWNHGAANDPDAATRTNRGDSTTGDNVGTKQTDNLGTHTHGPGTLSGTANSAGSHSHTYTINSSYGGSPAPSAGNGFGATSISTDAAGAHTHTVSINGGVSASAGGNENRPKNINVIYCVSTATNSATTVASTGTGTSNYLPLWTSTTALGNSPVAVNGSNVGIGTATPISKLEVAGTIHSTSGGVKFPDGTTQTTAFTGIGGSTASRSSTSYTTVGTATWTKPAGADMVFVECWGGGGAGGRGIPGCGGGGGAYASAWFVAADISASVTVTVGGGAAGRSSDGVGSAGSGSSFGTYLIAAGGNGGTGGGYATCTGGGGGTVTLAATAISPAKEKGGAGGNADFNGPTCTAGGLSANYAGGGGGSNANGLSSVVCGGSGSLGGSGGAGGTGSGTGSGTNGGNPGGGGGSGGSGTSGSGGNGQCTVTTIIRS